MKALELISSSSFGPDPVEKLGTAFDSIWSEIAPSYTPADVVVARMRLATIVLGLGADLESARLREEAIRQMQQTPT